ncbi:MAG: DUF2953 domain-containing protein [Gemmatimonadetes bacterium]|nr:DUF2953 domain-containing protein [Gemmatimonadota bacterium]
MTPIFEPYLLIPVAVLLSMLMLLAIPVTISFSVVRREGFSGRITFGWLFGLLRISPSIPTGVRRKRKRRRPVRAPAESVESGGSDVPGEPGEPGESKAPSARTSADEKADGKRAPAERLRRVLKTRGFVRGVLRFLRDMARCVRFVSLHVAGRIGLDNPCDTGRLWGTFCALTGFLHGAERVRLRVEPDFDEAVFELDGRGEIRIVPVTLFLPFIRFFLAPATLRAAWAMSRRTGRTRPDGRTRRTRRTG